MQKPNRTQPPHHLLTPVVVSHYLNSQYADQSTMRRILKKGKEKLLKPQPKDDAQIQSDLQPVPNPAPASSSNIVPRQLQERLWNEAYEQLKSSNAEVVECYEKILSQELTSDQHVSSESESALLENRIETAYDERWKQMQTVMDVVMKRTKKKAVKRQTLGGGLTAVNIAMSQAVRTVPEAAVAWTGMLSNSAQEAKAHHEGIIYVISRMDWYWHLVDIFFNDIQNEPAPSTLRNRAEKHIVDLYQKLLLYQMKSVCRHYRLHGPTIWRDMIKADDWVGRLDEIRNAETTVQEDLNLFNASEIKKKLGEIDSVSRVLRSEMKSIRSMCRIEETNGGLLEGAYDWIITHDDFINWQNDSDSRLLWIKGDPGKGKTMLMCGIIDKLQSQTTSPYFVFCQATDPRLNNAKSVLRGLIYLLADKNRHLLPYIQEKYDQAGASLFQDANAWIALSQMFNKLLDDPGLADQVFMIDALDECLADREQLIDLIVLNSANYRGRWIVTSRNWTEIEVQFSTIPQTARLSLELNEDSVSEAVRFYINYKTTHLKKRVGLDNEAVRIVREYLTENARGTFLWVALVCKELMKLAVRKRHVLKKMAEFPPQLGPLYDRMMNQIRGSEDSDICERILNLVAIVYRPISLVELASILDMPNNLNDEDLEELVVACGSFLIVREGVILFVHQSAKDFLLKDKKLVPEPASQHYAVLCKSLEILSSTLHRNMYRLPHTGTLIKEHTQSQGQDVLRHVRYSCVFWVDHLKAVIGVDREKYEFLLQDDKIIHHFLKSKLLNWLEALSLMERMSDAIRTVSILKKLAGIELAPLQVYSAALFLSPVSSIVRQTYEETEGPKWVATQPEMLYDWTAYFQPFEVHKELVRVLAFSPDGAHLVSWSIDATGKLWDLDTGACLHTFVSDDKEVCKVVYSSDSKYLASGSSKKIQIWDLTTLTSLHTFETPIRNVQGLEFSPNCTQIAMSGYSPRNYEVYCWDPNTGMQLTAFAPDGTQLALLTARDGTIYIQNLTTHRHLTSISLKKDAFVEFATFSADASWVAMGGINIKIRIFDCFTGVCLQILGDISLSTDFLKFSKDPKIWDSTTGSCLTQLKLDENKYITAELTASSPDYGKRLAAGTYGMIQIWDIHSGVCLQETEIDGDKFPSPLAISPSNSTRLGAMLCDGTILIFDINTGTLVEHFDNFYDTGHGLNTALYQLDLRILMLDSLKRESQDLNHKLKLSRFDISRDKTWILHGQDRVLWLPQEYRPNKMAVYDNLVVIWPGYGGLLCFQFDIGEMDKDLAWNAITRA
ncbi:hypothetical protein GGI43DRAFT_420241 [Trichoderma evansii]